MSVRFGVTFGNHIAFTYGPLGFLDVNQLWYGDTGQIAFLYLIVIRIVLAATIYAGARRSFGGIAGFMIALYVVALSEDLVDVGFVIAAIYLIQLRLPPRIMSLIVALAGAIAAVEFLIKISVGMELILIVAVVALAADGHRTRYVLAGALGFVVTFLVSWGLASQEFGALPDYFRNSVQIVSGYSSAMSYEDPTIVWEYSGALVAFAFGLIAVWYTMSLETSRRRVGVIAIWVIFAFFEFKESFQRHDASHGGIYFSAMLGGLLAFHFVRGRRLVALMMLAAVAVFTLAAHNRPALSVINLSGDLDSAVTQFKEVFTARERLRIRLEGREGIVSSTPLDTETLMLLHGETVHVTPFEAALVWAYGLDWHPLPVFQSYAAYTAGLDRLNANALKSSKAPQRILFGMASGIDNRFQPFDEPATEQTILCRYQELHIERAWDVLGVGPDRCGQPVRISSIRAAWGQTIPVPSPPNEHTFVIVRVDGVQVTGAESLRAAIFRPKLRFVSINGANYRLVPGTADDGLVLRAPADLDFTPPFSIAPNAKSITVTLEGSQPGGRPIEYSFYEVPVTVGPRYRPFQHAIAAGSQIAGVQH
jgi:hypothetical protein